MAFVFVALRGFVHSAAGELPRLSEVGVDFRVFAIALLVSAATALLFGGLPALRAGRIDVQSVLQSAARGTTGGRPLMRRALVAVEVALSVVLLSGAALLFQTLWHMRNDHLGFQPEHLLTISIPLRATAYQGPARQELADEILAELNRMPGNQAASLTECSPLVGGSSGGTFSRSDRPLPEPWHRGDGIGICGADAEYLRAAGGRVIRGRFFTDDDFHNPGTRAVLNEAAVKTYFPGEDPLGKQILGARAAWKTVVGVIADAKNQGMNQPAGPEAWINDVANGWSPDLLFLVRTLAPESAVAQTLRSSHRDLFYEVQTLDDDIAQRTASPRFNTVLLSAFAAIAFLMAVVGVYGVLAFSVAQRRAEIGIRMALGATPEAVLALVMKEGSTTLLTGAILGAGAALLLTRYLATLLYGVTAADPATHAAVVAGLALAASCASFLPARRASKLDPAVALRHE
jgi:predicted permease